MSSEELKPCPFCGGDVSFHKDEECPGCHLIQCGQCRAFFDFATGADPGNDCESVDALRAAIAPMWNTRTQLAAIQSGMGEVVGWISVEDRLPPPNTKVLAFYTNRLGKGRRVTAEWIAKFTVEASEDCWGDDADYDEATDQYYSPEGWYERVDNWDELAYLFINEGKVTHWTPLPAAPALSTQCEGGA